jgi:transposase
MEAQLAERKTEPNSGLGKAIRYMLRHWLPLTLFLREPGAPVDNNLVERILKNYLTELQRHAEELKQRPSEWMPWNYRETLAQLARPTAA